jgi:hypothetical protein
MKHKIKITEKDLINIVKSSINEIANSGTEGGKLPCTCPKGYTLITGCKCTRNPDPDGTTYP